MNGGDTNSSVFTTDTFAGLDLLDRQVLMNWLAIARTSGVEAVADFTPRPWHLAGLDVVIGIFEKDQPAASWLLVRYQSRWVVATIRNDRISDVCSTLTEALSLIGWEPD
jgi:hypothetical protein